MKGEKIEVHGFYHMTRGCPKCGCWDVEQKYCSGCEAQGKEHLHCKCERCGYTAFTDTKA